MTFKVGDRVLVVKDSKYNGKTGQITSYDTMPGSRHPVGYFVNFDDNSGGLYFYESSLEPITELELKRSPLESLSVGLKDVLTPEEYAGLSSSVNPNHYKFPGGIEVRQISAHLTSFGGQALQYIARATRLDGNNKGEAVEDLEKAIRLIQWEIERIKADG